jgi:hypothetical protein
MTMKFTLCLSLALLLSACGGDADSQTAATNATPSTAIAKVVLDKDLGEATDISDIRKMKAGDEVTAVGRVQNISSGFAALRLIDQDIQWCNTNTMPWKYCCVDADLRNASLLPVEVRRDGDVVETNDIGLRLLDLIVVHGTLEKSEAGGLVLVSKDGWFRRERPDFSEREIDWPKLVE